MSRTDNSNSIATLYIPGETWLHKLHPFSKLVYILLTGVVVFLGSRGWFAEVFFITLNLGLARVGGVLTASWSLLWRTLLPLAIFMIVIHGLFHPGNRTILLSLGSLHFYQEGVFFGGNILLQLTAVLTASLLFVFCTDPVDLITAISQAGLPAALGYLVGSPLLLLPIMRARIGTIQAAQRSRGLDSEGSIIKRFLALFPLVAPLVLGALAEIEQRSIALEIRGFNETGPKTSWRIVSDTIGQKVLRWTMLFLSVMIIVLRMWR